jgi:DNA repair exonuclease SbcCD nuclease subunit
MANLLDDLSQKLTKDKPAILFGHFGVAEAGRGSESTMIAGNNICISSLLLDRPEIQHVFLGHIHKSWKWTGQYTNVTYFGSMDRFDFAEANDNKEYGIITVANNQIVYETVDTAARPFVDIKHYVGSDDDEEDVGFLSRYSLADAVVKVSIEVDKDFKGGDKILERVRKELTKQNAYHIHALNLLYKPTFVAKNAQVTEASSVEDNLRRVLLDEGFADTDSLFNAHVELIKEIQAEDDAEAEK